MKPLIIITRAAEDAKQTAVDVATLGFAVMSDPMLTIQPIECSQVISRHAAIIVTSRNALPWLEQQHCFYDVPLFIVGAQTAERFKAAGFTNIAAVVPQSADLPDVIQGAMSPSAGRVLHVTSEDAHTDFYEALLDTGYGIEQIYVYKAVAATALHADTIRALQEKRISAIMFYSARTARIFQTLIAEESLRDVTAFCLSDAVAHALNQSQWKAVCIAKAPTHNAMMDCLAKWG
jgi:uroporphyrinogen-III synthase